MSEGVIISDTSPLHYLILIGAVDLLPRLADEIVVPSAVARELTHPSTPQRVRAWLAHPPNWFSVTAPTTLDPSLDLGSGESEAISLALELGVRSILIDERKGFRAAVQRGLQPIGLLAVLEFSAANGWIDFDDTSPDCAVQLSGSTSASSRAFGSDSILAKRSRWHVSGFSAGQTRGQVFGSESIAPSTRYPGRQ